MRQLPRIALLGLVVVLATIHTAAKSTGAEEPAPVETPKEVRLAYFANVTHAQAVLGVASGDFEKAIGPAKLVTRVFNAGPSEIEALFAGEVDIGYIGPSPALSGFEKSRGEGLRVIAGAASNGVVIVARPDSGINSLKDLAGKRIASPQLGNTQDIAAKHYVKFVLNQDNTDNVIAIQNAEQSSMMSRGQIDAVWAVEPWAARLEKEAGAKVIAEEKDLWPNKEFGLTVIIVNPEFLKKYPDTVKRILEVHGQWTAKLQDSPESSAAQLHKALNELTGKNLDLAIIEKAISRVKFTTEPLPETFETFAKWSLELGFSKSKPDLSKLIDTSILKTVDQGKAVKAGNTQPAGSKSP